MHFAPTELGFEKTYGSYKHFVPSGTKRVNPPATAGWY